MRQGTKSAQGYLCVAAAGGRAERGSTGRARLRRAAAGGGNAADQARQFRVRLRQPLTEYLHAGVGSNNLIHESFVSCITTHPAFGFERWQNQTTGSLVCAMMMQYAVFVILLEVQTVVLPRDEHWDAPTKLLCHPALFTTRPPAGSTLPPQQLGQQQRHVEPDVAGHTVMVSQPACCGCTPLPRAPGGGSMPVSAASVAASSPHDCGSPPAACIDAAASAANCAPRVVRQSCYRGSQNPQRKRCMALLPSAGRQGCERMCGINGRKRGFMQVNVRKATKEAPAAGFAAGSVGWWGRA